MTKTYIELRSHYAANELYKFHPLGSWLEAGVDIDWEEVSYFVDQIVEHGDGIVFHLDALKTAIVSPSELTGGFQLEDGHWFYIQIDPKHGYTIDWRLKMDDPELADQSGILISEDGSEEEVEFGRYDDLVKRKYIFTDFHRIKDIVKYIFDHGVIPENIQADSERYS